MPKIAYKMFDRKTVGQSHIYLDQLPREANGIHNMSFDENGRLVKRLGFTKHNTGDVLSAHAITGLHRFYKVDTSTKFTLAVCDTVLYKLKNTTPWGGTPIKTGLTSGADMHFVDFANRCYMCNDENGLFKFGVDTTSVRTVGIPAPDVPTFKEFDTDGALGTGIYYFKVTYVDEDGYESNGSVASAAMTLTDSDDAITIYIPSANIDAVTFTGSGLNDATSGGVFSGDATVSFKVEITSETTPDKFKWTDDGGGSWTENVSITGSAQDLSNGVTVTFADTTNHTNGEYWEFSATIDPKVAKRRIYRTSVGGAIYYYDGEVDDNTSDTYDSLIADIALGTQLSTEHDAPPTSPQLLIKRENRIYLGDDEDLCISVLSDIEYFPVGWFIKTPDRRKITGMIEQMSKLIVFTEDTLSVLSGTDKDNFIFKKSYVGDGCIAPRSIQNLSNHIIFLSFNGLMAFNGYEIAEIDGRLNKYLRDNINYAAADTSCSCYYDDKYILSYPTNASHALGLSTVPNESVYFDYRTGKIGVFSFAFNVFSRWDKGDDGILIKGGSTTIGRVYNLFTGLDDDGSAIECYDKIMSMDFSLPEVEKNYYDIYIKVKSTTATTLTMYYTIDDNDETSNARQIDRSDIAFVDNDGGADTITTVAGDFTTFVAGDILVITGTDNNNGTVTIVSVAEKVITLATDTLTTETAGDAVLTANLTLVADSERWYRIRLPSSTRGRSIAIRPRINDKYQAEFQGNIIIYDTEELRV